MSGVPDNFCVLVLSHGRADNVETLRTLEAGGYTGPWFVIYDNEDEQGDRYRANFGDRAVCFDKAAVAETFDEMDTSGDRRTVVYARNVCFDIAERLGYRYFLELDDDYTSMEFRYAKGEKLLVRKCSDLDAVFAAYLDFLKDSGALTVAMAQGGDFVGGKNSGALKKVVLRKVMNSFFCDCEKRFTFVGRLNEDVNTYLVEGARGGLMLTCIDAAIVQERTQGNSGGMTDTYLDSGTYTKSFFSVIAAPSCVHVAMMASKHRRMHHQIDWDYAVPKILNECWRRSDVKA